MSAIVADYRRKRDRLVAGLRDRFEFVVPGGASTCSRRRRGATAREFVAEAIRHNLLIIPGGTFSGRDTHFRVSYAAEDTAIDRGIEVLNRLARR